MATRVSGAIPRPTRSSWIPPRLSSPLRQASTTMLLLGLWFWLSHAILDDAALPSPATVLRRAFELSVDGQLVRHVATSLSRVLIGYCIGSALGILAGAILGRFLLLEQLVAPTFGFVRSIPPIAFVPFSIILFGIGETSKYAIIVYLACIVLTLHTATGFRETPWIRTRAAQTLGARGGVILFKVVLPSAFPYILAGLEVALSLSFMAVVSAELIGARSGLGYLIMESRTMMETDKMLVGILCLGVLGAVVSQGAHALTATLLRRFTHKAS